MDINMEENIYHQIEKSLANNMNDGFFGVQEGRGTSSDRREQEGRGTSPDWKVQEGREILPDKQSRHGVLYDRQSRHELMHKPVEQPEELHEDNELQEYTRSFVPVSREEYIRQARESCLRQLDSLHAQSLSANEQIYDIDTIPEGRKTKALSLPVHSERAHSLKEAKSFRSLIIRTVCAAVIFLSIFIFDMLKVEWKSFSYRTIRQYVTEKDVLSDLETMLVSWLK